MNCIAATVAKLHPAEIILEEMCERNWSMAQLVEEMGPYLSHADHQVEYLAVDFYLTLQDPCFLIGGLADGFGKAFGTGPEFWTRLHNQWRAEALSKEDAHGGF